MLIQSVYAQSRGLELNFKPVLNRFTILFGLNTLIHGYATVDTKFGILSLQKEFNA